MFKIQNVIDFLNNKFNLKYQLKQKDRMLVEQETKLKTYINKIFEQQEKERIINFLIDSIRQSLELDDVFQNIVNEIGSVIDVDRCLLAVNDPADKAFIFTNEYLASDKIPSILNQVKIHKMSESLFQIMKENRQPYLLNSQAGNREYLEYCYIGSTEVNEVVYAPIIYQEEMLGIIVAENIKNAHSINKEHIEMIADVSNQIAIAMKHAYLYSKAQETTRLKSEFLSSISHELRTPLNGIISFTELMKDTEYDRDKQVRFLTNIEKSANHLLSVINDILDLSKIEAGKVELVKTDFNAKTVVLEVVELFETLSLKKNIKIMTDLEYVKLNADKKQFKQVLINIISNAIKFSKSDSIINIKSYIDDKHLFISVQDYGIGIAPEDKSKVFDMFTQIENVYTRNQEGTGLGLAIVRKIIDMHGGDITFTSSLGEGTTFTFKFPNAKSCSPASVE